MKMYFSPDPFVYSDVVCEATSHTRHYISHSCSCLRTITWSWHAVDFILDCMNAIFDLASAELYGWIWFTSCPYKPRTHTRLLHHIAAMPACPIHSWRVPCSPITLVHYISSLPKCKQYYTQVQDNVVSLKCSILQNKLKQVWTIQ